MQPKDSSLLALSIDPNAGAAITARRHWLMSPTAILLAQVTLTKSVVAMVSTVEALFSRPLGVSLGGNGTHQTHQGPISIPEPSGSSRSAATQKP